jgi:hypothetical protein
MEHSHLECWRRSEMSDAEWVSRNGDQPDSDSKAIEKVELAVIDPRQWQGKPVPTREWLVPDLIPAG